MSDDVGNPRARKPEWLLGRWRLVHAEPDIGFLPGTCMEFHRDGALRYTIPLEGREQVITLLYRTDDGLLRTENPLAPHATATPFRQGPGDTLVLDFPDGPAVLLREQDGERGW